MEIKPFLIHRGRQCKNEPEGVTNDNLPRRATHIEIPLAPIDDLGTCALPRNSGKYLLEIVMRRHENRSTIMTSNCPLEEWGKLFDDVPAASAILDRFLSRAIAVSITGRSYRLKDQATAKSEKATKTLKPESIHSTVDAASRGSDHGIDLGLRASSKSAKRRLIVSNLRTLRIWLY